MTASVASGLPAEPNPSRPRSKSDDFVIIEARMSSFRFIFRAVAFAVLCHTARLSFLEPRVNPGSRSQYFHVGRLNGLFSARLVSTWTNLSCIFNLIRN